MGVFFVGVFFVGGIFFSSGGGDLKIQISLIINKAPDLDLELFIIL